VDAETFLRAAEAARKKLSEEGYHFSLIDTITELEPSPAKPVETPLPKSSTDLTDLLDLLYPKRLCKAYWCGARTSSVSGFCGDHGGQ